MRETDRPTLARDAAHQTTPYLDALRAYAANEPARLNVPGHKAGSGADRRIVRALGPAAFELDVPPLLWGVDRGPSPTPLEQALELAADAWGARRTWFLTNGASQGNQATCLALRALGSTVVVQRSVHSSVIDGLVLSGLVPRFVAPTVDAELGVAHGVTPAAVAAALAAAGDDVAAAYVVTPSYFGAVADVAGCAAAAHAAGVPLIVDEAWGAHFGFHPALPHNALRQGADVVISSTHKLAGSLTQSAMLHIGAGPFADVLEAQLERAHRALESTSASSLLYASLDAARHNLAVDGERLFGEALEAAGELRRAVREEVGLPVADAAFLRYDDVVAFDPLRVVIDTRATGLDGLQVGARLRALAGVDVEVLSRAAIVAVIGPGEQREGGRALVRGLAALPVAERPLPNWTAGATAVGTPAMSPREAFLAPTEVVPAAHAVGRISADSLATYPPGIPNVLPGEQVTADVIAALQRCVEQGGWVRGAPTGAVTHLRVVRAD
ncbi:Orn/Lys/Arg decarboxylase major region [Conexibacter woesei DSM 14684]|uniref:Orn/Lys/Arg decarboxylase major region n=2 Tax=Conexibacter TaxID=191494 RepID=D3F6E9_CONWI|nr:Orn/Lys/Arg decarboxylase major region [Conexibacter woesei DSM 14684]